jgi:hypothetical protein
MFNHYFHMKHFFVEPLQIYPSGFFSWLINAKIFNGALLNEYTSVKLWKKFNIEVFKTHDRAGL